MTVDLQTNLVAIDPAPDHALDLAALPRAVRRSGFRPGAMRLRAEGSFVSLEAGLGFLITGWPRPLPIRGDGATPGGTAIIETEVGVEDEHVRLQIVQPAGDPFRAAGH